MRICWHLTSYFTEIVYRAQSAMDGVKQNFLADRFWQKIDGPCFNGFRLDARAFIRADVNDRDCMLIFVEATLQRQAVHARHLYVKQQAARLSKRFGLDKLLG